MRTALTGGTLVLPNESSQGSLIFSERIESIQLLDRVCANDYASTPFFEAHETIDVTGLFVAPGFIDVHIHGSAGADVMDASEQSLALISETIIKTGTTRFLATTMTLSVSEILASLEAVSNYMGHETGAKILGVHLEGPFISPNAAGAQNASQIIRPDASLFSDYESLIKVVTYAPEVDENLEYTKHLVHKQIVPSIGHTKCTCGQALEAIDAGARGFTHLFNAMTPLHHRNPGAVGAALSSDAYVELIADTVHVHPSLFSVVEKVKTPDRMLLVTDAMRAACLKDGIYDLGGQSVTVKGSEAKLSDGTLAGSTLNQMAAVRHMIQWTTLSPHEVIRMVTLTPARYLGIDQEFGSLEIGKVSDVIVYDANYEVVYAFVAGKCVWNRRTT